MYFIKILSGSRNFWHNLRATDPSLHADVITYQKLYFKVKKTELDLNFLIKCRDNNITPKFVRWKNLKFKRHNLRSTYHGKILKETIQDQHKSLVTLKKSLNEQEILLTSRTTWLQNLKLKYNAQRPMDKKLLSTSLRHQRKFQSLLREHSILTGIKNNPNLIITNLTGDQLTNEEETILRFGLKHNLATRPNETEVIANAESIWDQLKRQNLLPDSFIKQQKIKNAIKPLACNLLDFDDRQLTNDNKRIKILKNLRQKYAILKPDKGKGIVLIKINDYKLCMTDLFSNTNKFMKVNKDTTLTQLTTLQTYLRKILNRGEITNDEYNNVRPVYTRPA